MPVLPPPVKIIKEADGTIRYECVGCGGLPHDWKKGEECPKSK